MMNDDTMVEMARHGKRVCIAVLEPRTRIEKFNALKVKHPDLKWLEARSLGVHPSGGEVFIQAVKDDRARNLTGINFNKVVWESAVDEPDDETWRRLRSLERWPA